MTLLEAIFTPSAIDADILNILGGIALILIALVTAPIWISYYAIKFSVMGTLWVVEFIFEHIEIELKSIISKFK